MSLILRKFLNFSSILIAVTCSSAFADSAKLTFNGHSYQRFDTSMKWTDGKLFCESKGGYLATITSLAENNFIAQNFVKPAGASNTTVMLGGTDSDTEGVWRWITGEPWGYTNWRTGQPDNFQRNQNYLIFYNYGGETIWDDYSDINDGHLFPLCEWNQSVDDVIVGVGVRADAVQFPNSIRSIQIGANTIEWDKTKLAGNTVDLWYLNDSSIGIDNVSTLDFVRSKKLVRIASGVSNSGRYSFVYTGSKKNPRILIASNLNSWAISDPTRNQLTSLTQVPVQNRSTSVVSIATDKGVYFDGDRISLKFSSAPGSLDVSQLYNLRLRAVDSNFNEYHYNGSDFSASPALLLEQVSISEILDWVDYPLNFVFSGFGSAFSRYSFVLTVEDLSGQTISSSATSFKYQGIRQARNYVTGSLNKESSVNNPVISINSQKSTANSWFGKDKLTTLERGSRFAYNVFTHVMPFLAIHGAIQYVDDLADTFFEYREDPALCPNAYQANNQDCPFVDNLLAIKMVLGFLGISDKNASTDVASLFEQQALDGVAEHFRSIRGTQIAAAGNTQVLEFDLSFSESARFLTAGRNKSFVFSLVPINVCIESATQNDTAQLDLNYPTCIKNDQDPANIKSLTVQSPHEFTTSGKTVLGKSNTVKMRDNIKLGLYLIEIRLNGPEGPIVHRQPVFFDGGNTGVTIPTESIKAALN